jgi:dCTP deaminase
MSILNDKQIAGLALGEEMMISPFVAESVRELDGIKALSFGLSSFGYDVRLKEEVKIFTNMNGCLVDPKNLDNNTLVDGVIHKDHTGTFTILPPNSYLLSSTAEYFKIPRDITVIAVGKSTLARAGLLINVTPIEAGFEGEVVIEIANCTSLPIKVYLNEGISQFIFFRGEPCSVSYGDRSGKYQHQTGITLPRV